jgi:hypothetical protein
MVTSGSWMGEQFQPLEDSWRLTSATLCAATTPDYRVARTNVKRYFCALQHDGNLAR